MAEKLDCGCVRIGGVRRFCDAHYDALFVAPLQSDQACDDAMRLLEAIATIIDGPIQDTRLHDWSGLPERVRLNVEYGKTMRLLLEVVQDVIVPAPPDAKETL